jgi:PAS domain S-box-containing protein
MTLIGVPAMPILLGVLGLLVVMLGVALISLVRRTRAATQAAVDHERALLAFALARPTDGVWDWHIPSGSMVRGAALWRHLGYDPATMLAHPSTWSGLVHPEDRPRMQAAIQSHLNGKEPAFESIYRVQARDGQWHEVSDRGRVVQRSPGGAATRVIGLTTDITDRQRGERALREMATLATMGRLAARIAHQVNNPLGGIQNAFMLVRDAVPSTHPHFKYVGAIDREIQRIAVITRQLYETYRPEHEGAPNASIAIVVSDALAFLQQATQARRVCVAVDLTRSPAIVPVEEAILRQCVYNLIQNAVDASPDGAIVSVTGSLEFQCFVLRVRDHGLGVPPAVRARLQEPDMLPRDTGVRIGGMGLGLALVRRSVHALGGRLDVETPRDGGAEFVVRFPLASPTGGMPGRTAMAAALPATDR